MILKSVLKMVNETKYNVIDNEEHEFETIKVDYLAPVEEFSKNRRAEVYEALANDLLYLKVFKSPVYKRLVQRNNYDGTRTVIIYQDNGRSVYRIKQ